MASTEKTTVTREVVSTVEEEQVVLTLSPDEARVLRTFLSDFNLGGDFTDARALIHGIRDSLQKAGLSTDWTVADQMSGQILFSEK